MGKKVKKKTNSEPAGDIEAGPDEVDASQVETEIVGKTRPSAGGTPVKEDPRTSYNEWADEYKDGKRLSQHEEAASDPRDENPTAGAKKLLVGGGCILCVFSTLIMLIILCVEEPTDLFSNPGGAI